MGNTIEMVDGRVFTSDDGWQTIYISRPGGKAPRKLTKQEADYVRFLVAYGAADATR